MRVSLPTQAQLRRRRLVFVAVQQRETFSLQSILDGGDGLLRSQHLHAYSPETGAEIDVSIDEVSALMELRVDVFAPARCGFDYSRLIRAGLVVELATSEISDRSFAGWHPVAALFHVFTRWDGVDAVTTMRQRGMETAAGLRKVLGPLPVAIESAGDHVMQLPFVDDNAYDELCKRRVTCRNFDRNVPLPLLELARTLHRTLRAHATTVVSSDTEFYKKNVPSGGGLHAVDGYVFARDVAGLKPGIYRYDAKAHELREKTPGSLAVEEFLSHALAGQHWFADAHALIALVARFDRAHWKYREHAKALRVLLIETGHIAQALCMAATEAGLGAFVTAAVNDTAFEEALGLDTTQEGITAICGVGPRSSRMQTSELDPGARVWPAGTRPSD